MKKIPLTKGKFALVDDEDYEHISKYKWFYYKHKNTNTGYAGRNLKVGFNRYNYTMHRFILGDKSGYQIDHIDGNGLNNQKSNLRYATRNQNQFNRTKYRNNTSGYKGVSFEKESGKFVANIQINNKQIKIGRFKTAEEAHEAYKKAAIKYHGEFAKW